MSLSSRRILAAALLVAVVAAGISMQRSATHSRDAASHPDKLARLQSQLEEVQQAADSFEHGQRRLYPNEAAATRPAVSRIAGDLASVRDAAVGFASTRAPRFATLADGALMLLAQAEETDAEAEAAAPAEDPAPGVQGRMRGALPALTPIQPPTGDLGDAQIVDADDVASPAAVAVNRSYRGDPMEQPVNLDFRNMELSNVVALLAQKAGINVIAGTEVTGTVTANLRGIPLRRAMEMVLRMNGLGMVEEEGIYRIVPYEEAVAARRETEMVYLKNAQANDIKKTLSEVLPPSDAPLVSISANAATNVLIISGAEKLVREMSTLARSLDVAEPALPTVTEAIKLNYSAPPEVAAMVKGMLTPEVGQVALDERSRHIIVTDIPVVVEQIRDLITTVDLPVKQVSIETMIIDAVMADSSQTGVDWVASLLQRRNTRGEVVGSLQNLDFVSTLGVPQAASALAFGILTDDIDIRAIISAEVASNNAKLVANPMVTTVENRPARITIAQEIPYQELTQSTTGPPISSTEFKEVGTILQVTPRVTHDQHIIVELDAKQSDTKGTSITGIPPEDKRETQTTLRVKDSQTIYIGGLRRFDDENTVRKVPVLGDVPVMNFLFRRNTVIKENTELLIFMTCHILPDILPELTEQQRARYDELSGIPQVPNSQHQIIHDARYPGDMRDPAWKWRKAE